MSTRSIKDATRALQPYFSAAKLPLSLPSEARRMLQTFVGENEDALSEDESTRANLELKYFWERYVGDSPAKNGAFVGVLRELGPAILGKTDSMEWWQLVVKPFVTSTGHRKAALEDAQEFMVECMCYDDDDDDDDAHDQAKTSGRLLSELLGVYVSRTRGLSEDDQFVAPENAQIAQQVENTLVAFGRRQPKDLFHSLDDLVVSANTRLQGLTLLSSFLRHQAPHLYLVLNTPLIEHLLKSLMNDTSTTVLSVALTSLIMLLPHIPGSLGPHLPRLFLIYSRLLCWEKFSPLSTEAQRDLVTDDRVSTDPDVDHGDVGIDPTWEKARPKDNLSESATPELMTYFTYLYGLYPLNFLSYVRKPRRYLKNLDFPGADEFDLDQTVIRSRTDQFRQVHLLHPNFYNLTIEEELNDPKWPKIDPADVVAECHGLFVNPNAISKPSLTAPGPPPTGRLPDVPPVPPLGLSAPRGGQVSPSNSHTSFRSGTSGRDAQSTPVSAPSADPDSPTLRPQISPSDDEGMPRQFKRRSKASTARTSIDDFPQPGGKSSIRSLRDKDEAPQTNLAYLQREVTLLRNDLNFERWHKAQYGQHIGLMMRKNVNDATAEAETLNLINANRALKLQLEQVRNAREATIKDSALTRKQANSVEANMTERFATMKKEQEAWRADAEELRRLRAEMKQYRELLVQAEAREMTKSHQLEIMKRDLEQMQKIQAQLQEAQRKLREYEYREFEFDQAKREQEILQSEKDMLQMRVQRHQQDQDRIRRVYADKGAELEAQLEVSEPNYQRRPSNMSTPDSQFLVQQAVAEGQSKLAQLKKTYTRLLEKHTDLELEYASVKSQLESLQGIRNGQSFLSDADQPDGYHFGSHDTMSGGLGGQSDSGYDGMSEYTPDPAFPPSNSDPSNRRYQQPFRGMPVSPPASEAAMHSSAGLTFRAPVNRQDSQASRSSSIPSTFNHTAPLSQDEMVRESSRTPVMSPSERSDSSAGMRKAKIQPNSEVRVFGRGGAQNIKMKEKKENQKGNGDKGGKTGGLKGLRNLV